MKLISKNKILIAILVLSAILRFYRLGTYPALNADEAAIGYNAYSLLQTGKDEHGNPWPTHFQSFNDYKPGGYFYMVLPFVRVLGLNTWSIRLPGATLGVLTVLGIYLLVNELNKNHRSLVTGHWSLIASLLLAISPWHIHFSRGGWEVNAATFFVVLGVYFFIKGVKDNNYLSLSVIAFVISLYTYHAARVLVPFLGISLLVVYREKMLAKLNIKMFLGSVLLAVVLLLPLAYEIVSPVASSRASSVSIFADKGFVDRINESRGRYEDSNSLVAKILHNKPKEISLEFVRNYSDHFLGEFLFLSGDDIQRNKVPEFGQLYLWQFPLLVIAAFAIARRPRMWGVVLAWLVIAPIPAALTFQSPHALRAQNMIIPLTVLSAYGLSEVLNYLQKVINKKYLPITIYCLLITVGIWSFARYIHQYYVHMAKSYPYSSQYGVEELSQYLKTNDSKRVVITTRYDQPYILLLFYLQYSPEAFQSAHVLSGRDEYGFSTVPAFDRYEFKAIDFERDKLVYKNSLIVGSDEEIPDETNIIKNIYGENGFLYFQVVAN